MAPKSHPKQEIMSYILPDKTHSWLDQTNPGGTPGWSSVYWLKNSENSSGIRISQDISPEGLLGCFVHKKG